MAFSAVQAELRDFVAPIRSMEDRPTPAAEALVRQCVKLTKTEAEDGADEASLEASMLRLE